MALALAGCGASSPTSSLASSSRASVEAAETEAASEPEGKQMLPPWSNATSASVVTLPSGPGQRVLQTADRMLDEGTVVRGSCYRYIDRVFTEAGYRGWRRRSEVFRGSRNGPYADLDLIEPGDWLWIVNHPEATPVGTHSVLFVEWQDRARGDARVVSYVGGRADRPADATSYDVSRTYGIMRAVESH